MVRFLALGGGREIGANSFYLNIDGHGLLIDGGLHPEKTGWEAFPQVEALAGSKVDTFVVTHAHTDHLGGVPFVLQSFPQAKVYMTEETHDLARIMLSNSVSLMPRQHPTEIMEALPNYTPEAMPDLIDSFRTQPLRIQQTIANGTPESTIKTSFYQSGHILGAVGVLIEHNGRKIFHTGDTSLHEQHLVAAAELPETEVDVLISESTNGVKDAYLTHDRDVEFKRLLISLNQTLEAGGSVMIPVFALGKMQEIISMLWSAMEDGLLPKVDLYTGGMARKISDVYDKFIDSASRTDNNTKICDIPQVELPRRDGLFSGKYFREPSIVLASSGMMQEGTGSYFLAQRWLRERTFSICFVGYTDPRTPGYVVSNAKKGDRIRFGSMKRDVPVRCNIERFRFSAHARRDELLEIVGRLKPKHVVLTHGDEAAMAAFGDLILQTYPGTSVSAPEVGKWYKLLD